MGYRLIVLDWDGTLMDSAARIVSSLQAGFADVGVEAPAPAQCREIIGLGLDESMARLAPAASPAERARLIERYRHHYLVADHTPTPLFPGAAQALDALRAAGYWLAVATGKSRRGLDRALAQSGLGGRFQATRCADETLSKPHPQMLLELLDELGVHAREALMVGDTEYDLQMAHNAGVAPLAVSCGVHAADRLLALRPLACLPGVEALPDWLAAAD